MKYLFVLLLLPAFAHADDISWFKGDMPAALKEAASSGKPLMVYWGAVWCPPCNLLKAGAFKDPNFVATTREFIPVYLDGDTVDAQTWGEKLKASGYPTLLVLNSQGAETARLVTYASVPDLTRALASAATDAVSTEDLLKRDQLTPAQWSRLAKNDWFGGGEEMPAVAKRLGALAAKAPPEQKLSFEIQTLVADVMVAKDKPDAALSKRSADMLRLLLSKPDLLAAHAMEITFVTDLLVKAAYPESEVPRQKLALKVRQAFAKLKRASLVERSNLIYPFFQLSRGADEKFPAFTEADVKFLRTTLLDELRRAKDEHELSSVLNTLSYAFMKIGAHDEAKRILLKNLKRMKTQNEAYSLLAEIEAEQARYDQALAYRAKAFEVARGAATRTQWGYNYVLALTEYTPEDKDRIVKVTTDVITEALKAPDAFQGRSNRTLKRLASTFQGWAGPRGVKLPYTAETCQVDRCREFITALTKAP